MSDDKGKAMGPVEFPAHPGYRLWPDGDLECDLSLGPNARRTGVWRALAGSKHSRARGRHVVLRSGDRRSAYVHNLVMEVFVGPPPSPGMVVRHRDGDRLNNRLENLYYGWRDHETRTAKLDPEGVLAIRRRHAAGEEQEVLAREYGVRQSVISDACTGKTWKHVGVHS